MRHMASLVPTEPIPCYTFDGEWGDFLMLRILALGLLVVAGAYGYEIVTKDDIGVSRMVNTAAAGAKNIFAGGYGMATGVTTGVGGATKGLANSAGGLVGNAAAALGN